MTDSNDLREKIREMHARVAKTMLTDGFEDAKKAYKRFGIPFAPQTLEEYIQWLAKKYPMPTIDDWL